MLGFVELGAGSIPRPLSAKFRQPCLRGQVGMTLGVPLCRRGARFGVVVVLVVVVVVVVVEEEVVVVVVVVEVVVVVVVVVVAVVVVLLLVLFVFSCRCSCCGGSFCYLLYYC